MHFSVFVPLIIALVLSSLSVRRGGVPVTSGVYRYPRAFSLVLMVATALMFTVPLWPGVGFTTFETIGVEGFFTLFFLIGVSIEFFRVKVSDVDIKQGFWPVKNRVSFAEMISIEISERRRGGYLEVVMKNGKKLRFDDMLESFSYFCQDVAKKGRQNSVEVTTR